MSSGLEIRDAVVAYERGPTAVDRLSLDVPAGQVLALLGPSGCGKSSLLRAVAGLEPLAAGELRWDGQDVAAVPVHRRGFGLMFQDGQLFPHRDVAGNVAYGLAMARVPREERRRRVDELLDLVGLAGYGGREVTTLSGGEQQRVALARALAPRPRLMLLDEPLSSLDRSLREHLAGELRGILAAAGATAIYVTHDHDEAFTVAARVGVMSAGRLLQVDTPERLWREPASEQVARFLGYGPVVDAVVVDGHLRGPLGTVPVPAGKNCTVGALSGGASGGASGGVAADAAGGVVAGRVRLALGPRALVADDDGVPLRVRGWRVRRGESELDVVLPDGQDAVVRVAGTAAHEPEQVTARLDLEQVAVLAAHEDGEEPA